MTADEYCKTHNTIAVISLGLTGILIHGIEYGIDDHVYCEDTRDNSYHKCKVHYESDGKDYFCIGGERFYLSNALRTNL